MLILVAVLVSVATSDLAPPPYDPALIGTVAEVLETSHVIREEAVNIREEAQDIRQEAYSVINQAYEIREETRESKRELEHNLVEAISLIMEELAFRREASAADLYMQEIRNTLSSVVEKVDRLEEKVDRLEEKVEEKGEETAAATNIVRNRLQVWMSEIRLISLYKIAEQTTTHSTHGADLAVDGQFVFDSHFDSSMRTYSHSLNNEPNNKIWIKLGGLFRIYKVKVWNLAHCCQERLTGTRIYADDRLIGVIVQTVSQYESVIDEADGVYASTITLHQELAQYLHVVEVQTWGTGPFAPDDLFN